jgi:hypothetical protein
MLVDQHGILGSSHLDSNRDVHLVYFLGRALGGQLLRFQSRVHNISDILEAIKYLLLCNILVRNSKCLSHGVFHLGLEDIHLEGP